MKTYPLLAIALLATGTAPCQDAPRRMKMRDVATHEDIVAITKKARGKIPRRQTGPAI